MAHLHVNDHMIHMDNPQPPHGKSRKIIGMIIHIKEKMGHYTNYLAGMMGMSCGSNGSH